MNEDKEYYILISKYNINYNINSNIHSKAKAWEQGLCPVGRDVLFPTSIYIPNKFYRSIKTLYADTFHLYELFIYVYLRREEDIPTYGFLSLSARFYFMQILINGAMAIAPYPTNTSTLSEKTT